MNGKGVKEIYAIAISDPFFLEYDLKEKNV